MPQFSPLGIDFGDRLSAQNVVGGVATIAAVYEEAVSHCSLFWASKAKKRTFLIGMGTFQSDGGVGERRMSSSIFVPTTELSDERYYLMAFINNKFGEGEFPTLLRPTDFTLEGRLLFHSATRLQHFQQIVLLCQFEAARITAQPCLGKGTIHLVRNAFG